MMILPRAFIRACKRRKFRSKVADLSGDLTGGSLLMRTLILRRLFLRHVLDADEKYVGVLLPPTVAGLVTNMAVPLAGRVIVNLNYTVSSAVMNDCIQRCGIRHVLTSRKFMKRLDLDLDVELVYLEDLREKVTLADKFISAVGAYAMPASILERQLGLQHIAEDDLLTIIFTSGSEATPKGVMLSYGNIGANSEAIDRAIHLTPDDVMVGILPFFHSFGYTVTMWTVCSVDIKGIYHYSPLEGPKIGRLCEKHHATILVSTPTFLRHYLRRCKPEHLAALDVAVTGAEKLPIDLCDAFEKKFGVRPVEGYGATELSPLASVNLPPSRDVGTGSQKQGIREGTVGRPVPGVEAKVVDLDTGEDLGCKRRGMLLIQGRNVMQGYLGMQEKTAEVLRDGWYVTGDIAIIDDDGFITITGRESRFSKIGGEMVPHLHIEEALVEIIEAAKKENGTSEDDDQNDEGPQVAVTAIPDAKKGERLVVVHTTLDTTPAELCTALAEAGLPNLFIPSPKSFIQVDHLPMLGTGKLDLKGLRKIAADQLGEK